MSKYRRLNSGEAFVPGTCRVHGFPLSHYCESCKELKCRDCTNLSCKKKNHEFDWTANMVRKFEGDLKREVQPLRDQHERIKSSLEALSTSKIELKMAMAVREQEIKQQFDSLVKVFEQEKEYFTNCARRLFQKQDDIYSIRKSELLEELRKSEDVILSVETASQNKSDVEFFHSVAGIKQSIEQCRMEVNDLSSNSLKFPEMDLHLCGIEELRFFNISRNFEYTKSDPLMCHTERTHNLESIAINETSLTTLLVGKSGKFDFTVFLYCCSDHCSEEVAVKKIVDKEYSLPIFPRKRGKHELHVKYDGKIVCQIPMFVIVPPKQLEILSAVEVDSVSGVKFHHGKLFVSRFRKAVVKIDPSTLSVEDEIHVSGVNEFCLDDQYIYATDVHNHQIVKMNKRGSTVASIGTPGSDPGQFNYPNGIQLSKDRELYVCDTDNHRIQVFNQNLEIVRIIGKRGCEDGCFRSPNDLDFDEDGNLYVVEQGGGHVQVLTPQGQHVRNIGGLGEEPGKLADPVSVAVCKDMVYVCDWGKNNHVSVFKTTGQFVGVFGKGVLSHPQCIATDDNGFVFITDNKSKVMKF